MARNNTKSGQPNRLKSIVLIIISLIFVAVVAVGTYLLIIANSTIDELNTKIIEQDNYIAMLLQSTPAPAPILELETLYNLKAALLQSYSDKARELKGLYEKDKDFAIWYSFSLDSYKQAHHVSTNVDVSGISKKHKMSTDVATMAIKSACFYTYADEMRMKLIEVEGIMDALKIQFLQDEYDRAIAMLETIVEIEF